MITNVTTILENYIELGVKERNKSWILRVVRKASVWLVSGLNISHLINFLKTPLSCYLSANCSLLSLANTIITFLIFTGYLLIIKQKAKNSYLAFQFNFVKNTNSANSLLVLNRIYLSLCFPSKKYPTECIFPLNYYHVFFTNKKERNLTKIIQLVSDRTGPQVVIKAAIY